MFTSCRLPMPQRMGFKPERAGNGKRFYSCLLPPRSFITAAMDLTVMSATERHSELIADFASKCARLCEAQMVVDRRGGDHTTGTVA